MTATTAVHRRPVPVVGWNGTEDEWLAARRRGLGASDIAAVLGFSTYTTPWQVWAEKTDARRPPEWVSAAADLGHALEPWLIEQASGLLDLPVTRTPHRLYAHAEHGWRMCSPDGAAGPRHFVEAKTAGLASGFGPPAGWSDGQIPLGYEFQCRWVMHVMDADVIDLVGLVANQGLVRRTVTRDVDVEHDMVTQVEQWWTTYVIGGVEPALGAVDNAVLAELYPQSNGMVVDLPGEVLEPWSAYREARDREKAAKADKEAAGAALKSLLGDNEVGRHAGQVLVTWGTKRGEVAWPRLVADLVNTTGVTSPDPEQYRKPSTRSLSVKD